MRWSDGPTTDRGRLGQHARVGIPKSGSAISDIARILLAAFYIRLVRDFAGTARPDRYPVAFVEIELKDKTAFLVLGML